MLVKNIFQIIKSITTKNAVTRAYFQNAAVNPRAGGEILQRKISVSLVKPYIHR